MTSSEDRAYVLAANARYEHIVECRDCHEHWIRAEDRTCPVFIELDARLDKALDDYLNS